MMYSEIYTYCLQKAFFKNHKKVLIAVSGGVDSMNLLHFLHTFKDQFKISIAIAHVNHKQRKASDLEEDYLKSWANQHDIPIFVDYFKGNFSEQRARDFRYQFFKRIMSQGGYTALVTAHHADDQVETVFMRLIRGSLLRHLAGIKEVQPFAGGQLIRPFLHFHKKTLPQPFHFEDSSNLGLDYFRNRVRNFYLKELEKENPKLSESLLALAEESATLFAALADLTNHIDVTDRKTFLEQTDSVQFYLLQNYLAKFDDLFLSRKQVKEVLHILRVKEEGKFFLKNHYELLITPEQFCIRKIRLETEHKEQELLLEYDSDLSYQSYKFTFRSQEAKIASEFSIPIYHLTPIMLRKRQPGDKIDFGTFSKKLRRLFIDEKFSQQERKDAIIGVQENEIIFVIIAGKTYLRKAPERDIMKARLYIEKLRKR
ncbi:tRNA lysidine(34) synthetase TilS [Streptococcus pseudoporcinus]|uniref:tRNA(Ile)-lysidine synthase n=1 Tax=Streptococcus pseudoporcinus LQ 940-04 TaxID=875093 RepID=G5KAH2_9STRE|nr:tRNA lysidine(34) synthetase TilS [Streptococcus pseudoporcinus]EFR45225.1 tRNA(Ile)-lysidine synthetase [Streptococcus pseudoporcinus SPIN 20026]EHI64092.1 tRNA(Ile)-lysidine synthetase [Streptococcus pseudoporcinus LQ 940-04]VEF93833.1 PP-loop family protein [Streptococcus pseudoporcinus]